MGKVGDGESMFNQTIYYVACINELYIDIFQIKRPSSSS